MDVCLNHDAIVLWIFMRCGYSFIPRNHKAVLSGSQCVLHKIFSNKPNIFKRL
uniref:Uncharacterized protein n=1 Tax=Anguilla anguilla TaxID=7936 RepID=A0A0E9X0J6_ANGAN